MTKGAGKSYMMFAVSPGWLWRDRIGLVLARFDHQDGRPVAASLEALDGRTGDWVPYNEESTNLPPCAMMFSKGQSDLQRLINDLWEFGVRPTQAEGSAGQLDATREHLKDMRGLG